MKKTLIQTLLATLIILLCAAWGMAVEQPEPRAAIDTAGHPFTGPRNAPVTVVVFSDYL
ncbi:MAG: hypothetical protein WC007_06445 [Pelobacteraceae bacterium]